MNIQHEDFIGIYKGVFQDGYCQHMISEFDRMAACGAGFNRQQAEVNAPKHRKDDHHIGLNFRGNIPSPFENRLANDIFFDGLQECFSDYVNRYSVLLDSDVYATAMKAQRTDPGCGYHLWHAESGNAVTSNRALVYMLYLNSLGPDEGGETEFLYQKKRYRPEENTMLIWPPGFTHAHRGNTVLGDTSKYIITGWFYYVK